MSRFTKISANGEQLPSDATEWAAVLDNNTSLTWSAADAVDDDVTHEEAEKAVDTLELAGQTDWRLPTVEELFLLADRSRISPAINTDFFPTTKNDWYWSSTLHAASPSGCAWVVYFGYGLSGYVYRDYDYRVRAVRGSSRQ